jgi:hypothetical protein
MRRARNAAKGDFSEHPPESMPSDYVPSSASGGELAPVKAESEEKTAPVAAVSTEIATPKNEEEYKSLPSGARYRHPDDPPGKFRTKK